MTLYTERCAVLANNVTNPCEGKGKPMSDVCRIGVNISERKSGTERTKKRKKLELVFPPPTRGHNWYVSISSRHYMDFAKVTITWDIFIAGPYAARIKSQLNNSSGKTHKI